MPADWDTQQKFNATMAPKKIVFTALADTHVNYKGRYVRFTGRPRKILDMNGKTFTLPNGAYGYCYSVNGATMYVALKESLLLPPLKSFNFATWNFHLSIRPHSDKGWEIENT